MQLEKDPRPDKNPTSSVNKAKRLGCKVTSGSEIEIELGNGASDVGRIRRS